MEAEFEMTSETVYVLFGLEGPGGARRVAGLYFDREHAERGARRLSECGVDAASVSIIEGPRTDSEFRALVEQYASVPVFKRASERRRFHRLSTKLGGGPESSIVWRPRWALRVMTICWLLLLATFPLWGDPIARILGVLGFLAAAYLAALAWLNTHTIQLEGPALVFRSRPVPFPGATRSVDAPEFASAWLEHVEVRQWLGSNVRLVHVADATWAAAIAYEINRRWFARSVVTALWMQRVNESGPDGA